MKIFASNAEYGGLYGFAQVLQSYALWWSGRRPEEPILLRDHLKRRILLCGWASLLKESTLGAAKTTFPSLINRPCSNHGRHKEEVQYQGMPMLAIRYTGAIKVTFPDVCADTRRSAYLLDVQDPSVEIPVGRFFDVAAAYPSDYVYFVLFSFDFNTLYSAISGACADG